MQKRLVDAEMVRTQYNRRVNILKDQVGTDTTQSKAHARKSTFQILGQI